MEIYPTRSQYSAKLCIDSLLCARRLCFLLRSRVSDDNMGLSAVLSVTEIHINMFPNTTIIIAYLFIPHVAYSWGLPAEDSEMS